LDCYSKKGFRPLQKKKKKKRKEGKEEERRGLNL
jgi:hypothetical protein